MDEDDGFARAPRRLRIGVGLAAGAVVLGVAATVGWGVLQSAGEMHEAVVPVSSPTAANVYVDVSGAVKRPGLYLLDADSRLVDAIAAAGGFAADADRSSVNLARPVADGEQVRVGVMGEVPVAGGVASDGVIDLNAASAAELEDLPRIGPALAERIVAWREENGRFGSVEDLLNVTGIGEKLLSGIRDKVRV